MTTGESVIEALRNKGLTLSTAESCTGGLAAKLVTDVAGSSEVFLGGVVSYANEVKMKLLGVGEETLASHGAVSEETARQMAEGVREATGSDVSVSTTGIAGPGGGTDAKPVGTVCFGVSSGRGTRSVMMHFGKDKSRDEIRRLAADFALSLVVEECGG